MKDYFTVDRTVAFLERCRREGINTFQFSPREPVLESIKRLKENGTDLHLICLDSSPEKIGEIVERTEPIALVHHGGATDRLFAEGRSSQVHDYVKAAHDQGVLAGVSAHNPDCIKRVADEGWEVDLFMACFYFLTRKGEPPGNPRGPATLPIGYPFYAADPQEMTAVMRQVKQPCLGFKILAAGRKCANEDVVREAFRWAFREIKPSDGVIVGMYPRFFDEISANAQYVREFAGGGPGRS